MHAQPLLFAQCIRFAGKTVREKVIPRATKYRAVAVMRQKKRDVWNIPLLYVPNYGMYQNNVAGTEQHPAAKKKSQLKQLLQFRTTRRAAEKGYGIV